jgi:hypothetical protein
MVKEDRPSIFLPIVTVISLTILSYQACTKLYVKFVNVVGKGELVIKGICTFTN